MLSGLVNLHVTLIYCPEQTIRATKQALAMPDVNVNDYVFESVPVIAINTTDRALLQFRMRVEVQFKLIALMCRVRTPERRTLVQVDDVLRLDHFREGLGILPGTVEDRHWVILEHDLLRTV